MTPDEKKIEDAATKSIPEHLLSGFEICIEHLRDSFKAGVKWRDENPSDELEELRKDKARLEWLMQSEQWIEWSLNFGFTLNGQVGKYFETPREAIDAARAESGLG